MAEQRYTDAEVEEILRRALTQSDANRSGVAHEDLVAAAAEVGLDREAVEAAAAAIERERAESSRRERALARLRSAFFREAARTTVLVGGLAALDAATGAGWWFQWPAIALGVVTVTRAMQAFAPSPKRLAREMRSLDREDEAERRAAEKARAKERAKDAERAFKESADTLKEALTAGATTLVDELSKQLRAAAARHAEAATNTHRDAPRVRVEVEARPVDVADATEARRSPSARSQAPKR